MPFKLKVVRWFSKYLFLSLCCSCYQSLQKARTILSTNKFNLFAVVEALFHSIPSFNMFSINAHKRFEFKSISCSQFDLYWEFVEWWEENLKLISSIFEEKGFYRRDESYAKKIRHKNLFWFHLLDIYIK